MTGNLHFEDALRRELVRVAGRKPPIRRAKVAVAAAVAAVVATLIALIPTSNPAAADIEVTHENGRVIVRLTDQESTAAEIEDATNEEGLDIRVEEVPTGPSNRGRFVGEEATTGDVTDFGRLESHGVSYVAFSLPEDWDGALTLLLGREARPGEPYRISSDAFAVGEPLACSGLLGAPLADLEGRLDDVEVIVQTFVDGSAQQSVSLAEALAGDHRSSPITGVSMTSATTALVDVGRSLPPRTTDEC